MDKLMLFNTVIVGGLFVIWRRDDYVNAALKGVLMLVLILDVVRLVK